MPQLYLETYPFIYSLLNITVEHWNNKETTIKNKYNKLKDKYFYYINRGNESR